MSVCARWDSWRKRWTGRGIFPGRYDAEERDREAARGAGAAQPAVLRRGRAGDQRLRVRSAAEAFAGAGGGASGARRSKFAYAARGWDADDRRLRDGHSRAADALDR